MITRESVDDKPPARTIHSPGRLPYQGARHRPRQGTVVINGKQFMVGSAGYAPTL